MQFANNPYMAQGYQKAREGMSLIRPFELQSGEVIYRFYDTGKATTPEMGARGVWWVDFESFQSIKHFALRHGYTFSYAARLFTAILYEWSEVDGFVRCEVSRPLQAWKGRGKQVQSKGTDGRDLPTMTPMQSVLEIYQLCIPGLSGPNSLAATALKVLGSGAL